MPRRIDKRPPPMAARFLVTSYIRDARRTYPDDNEDRLTYLDEKLKELDEQVQSGDWESQSNSFGGSSNSARRNITAKDRIEALEEAIHILTANPAATAKSSGVIIPRIHRTC